MKKFLLFLRGLLILCLWMFIFAHLANILFIAIWNFNLLSPNSWHVISSYWNGGGIIKSAQDVLLFTAMALLPIFFYIGWRFCLKINYLNLLLSPVYLFYRLINRDTKEIKRIVIHNIKSTEQRAEEIKSEIESLKPSKSESAQQIRTQIQRKIENDTQK